jgi:antitoxin (DNA-binding transcriptional repressor) of toxin-antitoxin stability system
MQSVPIEELAARLPDVLEKVEHGERFAITRDGAAVALIQPAMAPRKDVRQVIAEIEEFRKAHTLGGLTAKELIAEGRRY